MFFNLSTMIIFAIVSGCVGWVLSKMDSDKIPFNATNFCLEVFKSIMELFKFLTRKFVKLIMLFRKFKKQNSDI